MAGGGYGPLNFTLGHFRMSTEISHCPVCGHGPLEKPYSGAATLRQSYDICACCGCEFGYDDDEQYFAEWVAEGCQWFTPEEMPEGWKLESQLKHIIRPWPPA